MGSSSSKEGLSPGTAVITDGHLRLMEGSEVVIRSGFDSTPGGAPAKPAAGMRPGRNAESHPA